MEISFCSMKHISWITALLTASGVMSLWVSACGQSPVEPSSEVLNIGQTLGLAFTQFDGGQNLHLYARANPGAKKSLDRVLSDETLRQYHPNVWMIYRYIGSEADVNRIERTVQGGFSGVLSHEQRKLLGSMLNALGFMCRREVPGACELLVKWQNPSTWKSAKFRLYENLGPAQAPFEYDMVIRSVHAYVHSLHTDVLERVKAILAGIADAKLRDLVAAYLASAERAEGMGKRAARAAEARQPTPLELQAIESQFNGDLNQPGPSKPGSPPVPLRPGSPRGTPPDPSGPDDTLRGLGADVIDRDDGTFERVALSGSKFTDSELRLVGQLRGLRELSIAGCAVTDDGLAQIRSMRSLRRLAISRCSRVTDAGIAHLNALDHLEYLGLLYLPNLTDRGIERLKGLTKLKMLELTDARITDEGLRSLGGLRELEKLYISNAPITGEGLKHIRGLSTLKILLLRGTKLNDAGLEHLEGMTSLRKLVLGTTGSGGFTREVTAAGLARLKHALPECQVE